VSRLIAALAMRSASLSSARLRVALIQLREAGQDHAS